MSPVEARRVTAAEALRVATVQLVSQQAEVDRARAEQRHAIKAAFAAGLRAADIAAAARCSDKWVYAILRDAT